MATAKVTLSVTPKELQTIIDALALYARINEQVYREKLFNPVELEGDLRRNIIRAREMIQTIGLQKR